MSRPENPSRLRRLAVVSALAALPILAVPAAASADYTSANQWAGGTLAPDRSPGNTRYPVRGALVALTTSPTSARMSVTLTSRTCGYFAAVRGTVTPGPGGDPEHLVLAVAGTKRVRTRSARIDVSVSLQSAGPGVLTGTATLRGRYRRGSDRRFVRCNLTSAVLLRSRSALNAPLQPLSTDSALTRVGVLANTVEPKVRAAIAIAKRADGFHHAIWVARQSCRSGSKRSSQENTFFAPRFRIAADGTFRGREVFRIHRTTKRRRINYRFVGIVKGRIDPDGVARGTVTTTSRLRETGYRDLVCRIPSATFAAAP